MCVSAESGSTAVCSILCLQFGESAFGVKALSLHLSSARKSSDPLESFRTNHGISFGVNHV